MAPTSPMMSGSAGERPRKVGSVSAASAEPPLGPELIDRHRSYRQSVPCQLDPPQGQRQLQHSPRAERVASFQGKGTAVRFGNLAAQHESDARTRGLRREKWHEQVRGVRQAWPLVFNREPQQGIFLAPVDPDAAPGLKRT